MRIRHSESGVLGEAKKEKGKVPVTGPTRQGPIEFFIGIAVPLSKLMHVESVDLRFPPGRTLCTAKGGHRTKSP